MKGERPRAPSRDPAVQQGIRAALNQALGLIDYAADADFANIIERLRGEPGTNGGKQ